jgi:aspartyl protease family protein
MKRFAGVVMALVGVASIPVQALAQEHEGCFLTDSKGRVITLDSLCPSTSIPAPQSGDTLPPPPGIASQGSGLVVVPIKYRSGGTPVIDVKFNGSQTVEMLVDTGATGTVITQEVATALSVTESGTTTVDTASEKGVEFSLGQVQSLEVAPGIVIRDVTVAIGPTLDMGLLGQDLLGQYDITIRDRTIEFHLR